jgi:hypothetical protein
MLCCIFPAWLRWAFGATSLTMGKKRKIKEQIGMLDQHLAAAEKYVSRNVNVWGLSWLHLSDWKGKSGHPLWMKHKMIRHIASETKSAVGSVAAGSWPEAFRIWENSALTGLENSALTLALSPGRGKRHRSVRKAAILATPRYIFFHFLGGENGHCSVERRDLGKRVAAYFPSPRGRGTG